MTVPRSPTRRFVQLSGSNKLVLAEALLCLAGASLAIRAMPFRRTVKSMPFGARSAGTSDADRRPIVAQCRWAVEAWADRVPWKAVCFQRGLALHLMLRRRGIASVLHYGVAQSLEHGLRAHVWISADGETVLGGEEAAEFTCLATFPAAPGA